MAMEKVTWGLTYFDQFRCLLCVEYAPITVFTDWQNAVIGLLIFSASFGFVATVLAVCGVCTSPLPKKIYYFHSSGEIFFVCGKKSTLYKCINEFSIKV